MDLVEEDILMHYGVKRRSGRYPWGSGDNPYQHGGDFLARVEELQRLGKTEKQIADELHLSTTDLRMQVRVAKHERRALQADRARSLREDGKTLDEIASILGYANDSSVRALLNENTAANKNKAQATAEILKKELAEKGAIDVGTGVERQLGVSTGVLQEALFILETEGYNRYGVGVPQVNDPKKRTITPVISVPEIDQREVYQNLELVKSVGDYHSTDGGESWDKREYPASIDSSRVKILYGDEGGALKDGVIEIRRGVADLDLGDSHYAQVRILVDGTHYLKGMAMYSDDMPDGADIVFNTNKHTGTPKMDVLKKIQDDPDNPFGALIKANGQSHYIDADGNEKLSAINKLKEEGDWDKMSKNLSSQFLSKQPIQLIKKQLDLTYADAADEFSEICSLNNPTVKRKLLLDFADECDSAAVHLKAAALPRQSTQVILPLNAMKETEIFAPNYRDGEKVVLIRYPHGGTFEIPELTVNNKNPTAVSVLGKNIRDAVGINPKVAERLSGADFDGDQVVVIPTGGRVKIQSTPALKDLKDFDPKTDYSTEGKTGVRLLAKGAATQRQMGEISNLITDMTLKGATEPEIARAVKHSMVVIDAAKHKLDYRQSEKDNGIAELKKKYQGFDDETGHHGGASTLLSRRKQDVEVPERQGSGVIDPLTGKVVYKESGRTYVDPRTGKTVAATTKVKRILAVDDVRSMSSGTLQEEAYADYANKMKDLANKARLEYKATPTLKRSASAAKAFEPEVNRLMAALKVAQLNAPLEREAQRIANARVKAKVQANNITDKDEISKIRRAAISDARNSTGASGKRTRITISDGEWTAIQSGAISDTTLSEILRYAEPKTVRERATPRRTTQLSDARISRIKAMANSGNTNAEIAEALGISTSAVSKYLNS
ncbi:winged helix-turn-helix transcriptional regulator [Dysosmobacter welbionis]|uniref:Winged helix-turn-helix transcriptional regulator n=1 Tax=Dysosmobacter welbionis TaxID=2093857 RepID=A0A4D7ALL9_9FIRM|nr:winged helix-turn-helix transcriptional regulator [Dysosmobacter welbionis]QCI58553.1 winged helix-turn-helix transcriptional regulator [Dysosmobacter welbionis]